MRTLIIGGTGLISTAITRLLVERGDDVTAFNRGLTAPRIPEGVEQMRGDRKDYGAFEAAMRTAGPFDCVIDMVCFAPGDAESAVRAFAGRAGQLIFCSTVDVYAKPADRYPVTEAQARRPVSGYGRGKARCEDILLGADERGEPAVTVIRPAFTYGEGGSVVHTFGWGTEYLDRIRQGKPIVVHGDGSSLWVACHVEDVGRAFVAAAGNQATFGKAYHVTGEEWMTWNRYYEGIAEGMDAPTPTLVHIPTELLGRAAPTRAGVCVDNFQFNNIFDNSAAARDLGFRYTISWLEGVRRTVAWLDEHGRIDGSDDPFHDRLIAAWQRLGEDMAREMDPQN
ncbi:MAG: epimerase [Planctomycetes bacterium SM23_32]|nr:MAG: epimerase [Planctomycetes bacterium SM23_32]